MSDTAVIVPGLTVHGRESCLERVEKKKTEISLLARGDGPEVMFQRIAPGSRITLPATPGWDGFEFYYLLSGSLELEPEGASDAVVIEGGHYFTVHRLEQDVYFSTTAGVDLLYVSSRPVFHELSDEINQLLKLARTIEGKNPLVHNHCERLQDLALAVAEELRLSPSRIELLIYAAYLHDIGKADIPQEILEKTGPLTAEDWQHMHRHPTFGRLRLENTYLKDAGVIVEQHHERYDGKGYPKGLKGEEILVEAQIIAAVDSYDAMTSDRPYRKRLSQAQAMAELDRCSGTQFSPVVVEALKAVLEKRLDQGAAGEAAAGERI